MTITGVACPRCHGRRSRVLETRAGVQYIRRRHLCLEPDCEDVVTERRVAGRLIPVKGTRWNTYQFLSTHRGEITVPRDTRAIRSVSAFR